MKLFSFVLCICQVVMMFNQGMVFADQPCSFGHHCADIHATLQKEQVCDEMFSQFVERIFSENTKLTPRDWETIASLTRQYVRIKVKQNDRDISKNTIKKLLTVVGMPSHIRAEIRVILQKMNPDGMSLRDLITQFHSIETNCESKEDSLFLQLYSMALHSSYEDRKQQILLAKERGKYLEALDLCGQLADSIEKGECGPHPDVLAIEKFFLRKTILGLKIAKAREAQETCESLLLPYCQAEQEYAQAVDALVINIEKGNVSRAHAIDVLLLSHALYTLPWDVDRGIHELEVLIDHGNHLESTLLCYGYFSLLEIYHRNQNLFAMERLLFKGEKIFTSDHMYFPEYRFFLGCYFYEQKDYSKAQEYFLSTLDYASRLGVTLARVYEYLGCIAYRDHYYEKAENFFLRAYKSWNRDEAGLGLFCTYAIQHKQDLCREFLSKAPASFLYQKLLRAINTLFLQQEKRPVSDVVKVCNLLSHHDISLNDLYHHIVNDMIKRYGVSSHNPVLSLIYHQLDQEEQKYLVRAKKEITNQAYEHALDLWLHFRLGDLVDYFANRKNLSSLEDIARHSYMALYQKQESASDFLHKQFSHERSALQSTMRLVWALTTKNKRIGVKAYCDHLHLRLHGDRLYILAYDIEEYVSGEKEAIKHLSLFQDLFPYSSLLPLVHYLQGCAETSFFRRVNWFVKALDEFATVTLSEDNAKTWAHIYYLLKLDLAESYLVLRDPKRAVAIFEEIKEDWLASHHPRVSLILEPHQRLSMEMRWVAGLTLAYSTLGEKEKIVEHLTDHIEKRLLEAYSRKDYFREMIATTLSLCESFL